MTPERTTHSAQLARLAGALAVLVGAVVLTGWALDLAPLKSVLPGWVTMKPNTAGAFILTGLALLLSTTFRLPPWCARLAQLCALLAGLIGLLSLAEYIFGWHPGFDQWLFPEPAGAVGTSDMGRMAPDTALCFMLFAAGFAIARRPRQTMGILIAVLLFGSAITAVALIELSSYFSPTFRAYGWGGLTMMALPTAVVFAALGVALISIAVRSETSTADSPAQPSMQSGSSGGPTLLLIFALLTTAIIAVGSVYLRSYEYHSRSDAEQELAAIADLKSNELKLWRKERLADGFIIFHNSAFSALVWRYLEKQEETDAQRQLQQWIEKIQLHYSYDRVDLLDAQGVTRVSSPAGLTPASPEVARGAAEALRSDQVRLQDFYGNKSDQRIYLAILVPIFEEAGARRPLGTVVLRIDPKSYLFPFIQSWPTPSLTAETLLFRREGNDVLYLNDLRFHQGAALSLRFPLTRDDLPAAKAVLGQRGITQGNDYRGQQVLAALRDIPNSPWYMVAKIDLAEINKPIREHLWQVIVMIGIMLFGAGAGVGLVWRRQRLKLILSNYESTAARAQLAAIVESSSDAIIGKDLAGHITSWNEGAEKLFGYAADEIAGAPLERVLPPNRGEEEAIIRQIQRGERVPNYDTVGLTKDGRPLNVSVTSSPIRNGAGELVGASKVVHDISARLRAEEQLRASELRYRTIFDSHPVPLLLYDLETLQIREANSAAERQYGFTREEFLALKITDLFPTEDVQAVLLEIKRVHTDLTSTREWRHRRKDQTLISVAIVSSPLVFEGHPSRIVIATDITEQKLFEEKTLQLQRLESLGMLAAGIAHDLNNVLTPILFAPPLLRASHPSERDLKILDNLERSALRGASLVKQILGFARSSSGEFQPIQLKHITRDIIDIMEETFPKNIVLEHSIPSDLWAVQGNPTQVHQVLLNLCVNARDAMPAGGTLRLTASNRTLEAVEAAAIPESRAGSWLELEVSDTGTGIPPEILERIWQPFFTTKDPGKGTGLGLSTVRGIVVNHQGFVELHTEVGHGTTFRVFLPVAASDRPLEATPLPVPIPAGGSEFILVADDDPIIRDLLTWILEEHGYRVINCPNGWEALALFSASPDKFQLLITDLTMPWLGGLELIRAILQIPSRIRLIGMSGMADNKSSESDIAAVKALTHAFIAKPFTANALLALVHRTLHPAGKA